MCHEIQMLEMEFEVDKLVMLGLLVCRLRPLDDGPMGTFVQVVQECHLSGMTLRPGPEDLHPGVQAS